MQYQSVLQLPWTHHFFFQGRISFAALSNLLVVVVIVSLSLSTRCPLYILVTEKQRHTNTLFMRHRAVHHHHHHSISTLSASSSCSSSSSPSSPPPPVSPRRLSSSSTTTTTTTTLPVLLKGSLLQDLTKQEEERGLTAATATISATTTLLQEEDEEESSSLSLTNQLLPRPSLSSYSWWRQRQQQPLFGTAANSIIINNNKMPTKKDINDRSSAITTTTTTTSDCSIPKFAYRELTLGRVIGQGGFSMVYEITSMDLDEVFDTSEQEAILRKEFARHVNSNKNGGDNNNNTCRYVLKTLRTDLPEDEHVKGVMDLAIEADFLCNIPSLRQHINFIKIMAMANTDPHSNRFFVVLERLDVTLEKKFNYWRKVVSDNAGYYIPCIGCYCCSKTPILHALWKERFQVSLDIASAMLFLHKEGIVYRDLKPDNIGFAGNVVKLFDFGLAKRLKDAEPNENDTISLNDNNNNNTGPTYHLTGNTGSLRYMAPEVARDECYGLSVDVYSFGIIFWQICSLQTPYAKYSAKMHAERVVRQGQRPKPDISWPRRWVLLQQSCWSSDYTMRPSFDAIVAELTEILHEMEDDDGVIPTRATELIRAKKKKKPIAEHSLDVDTRISSPSPASTTTATDGTSSSDATNKRFDNDIV